jgi:hypothetical protein
MAGVRVIITWVMAVPLERRSAMLRNTRVQMAAVLAVGALLGWLAAAGRLAPFARACAGQVLAPAESSSTALRWTGCP